MAEWLLEPAYWNWFLLGLLLLIAEALLPGIALAWLGLSALCVGLMLVLFPALAWQFQWLAFALLAAALVVAWWLYDRRRRPRAAGTALNRRGRQYLGRVLALEVPIVNGQGRIRLDDSSWKVIGPDCPAGARVRVIGADGTVLQVEIERDPPNTS